MNKLLSMFFDVCRLRAAPQDLPTSRSLMVSALALYALLSIVISVVQMSLVKALLAAFMDTALLAGLSFFLLWARMFAHRWVQTCTALAGSGAVLEVVALPLMI